MSDEPDWALSSNSGKPTASDIMPRLVEEFPKFRPRWEKHLEFWKGEPAGGFNDIAQFVHFVVEDLYPSGETRQVQHAFDLMEWWLAKGNNAVSDIVVIGFFEDLRNLASWQPFGSAAFVSFLGPRSSEAWSELEKVWAGKKSLMDVVRSERKAGR